MSVQEAKMSIAAGDRPRWGLGFTAGVLGMLLGLLVAFPIFLAVGPSTVFNEELQSPKLSMVWDEIEPLPLMDRAPIAYAAITLFFGGIHGVVFAEVHKGIKGSTVRRGIVFGLIIWAVGSMFFEFNGPYSLLGEPLPLVGVEAAVALIAALIEGLVIAWLFSRYDRQGA